MNKEELLKEIMEWYDYKIKIENGKVVIDNGITDENYGLNFVGVKNDCGHFEYDSVDEALKDWLSNLEVSNEEQIPYEKTDYYIWNKEKIDFIKGL